LADLGQKWWYLQDFRKQVMGVESARDAGSRNKRELLEQLQLRVQCPLQPEDFWKVVQDFLGKKQALPRAGL
jgi:hypothetical protein